MEGRGVAYPVLPFRYKRDGGPRFCSGMVEQDVRTRQDATVALLSNSRDVGVVILEVVVEEDHQRLQTTTEGISEPSVLTWIYHLGRALPLERLRSGWEK